MKLNSYLLKATIVAALGGLLFGFDTAVIAGATKALSEVFSLSPAMLGFTVSSALWGTVLGSMLAGYPGDRYGRRDSLRILAVLYFLLRGWMRIGLELEFVHLGTVCRRSGYWRIVRAGTDVHR